MKIEELGEFRFIEHITRRESCYRNSSTLMGIGDDAAIIDYNEDKERLISTDLMIEGVNFDLTYMPIKHIGYKAVVVAASDIAAMGAVTEQLTISLAITDRFSVEDIDEFYEGVDIALKEYGIDLIGGDTSASHSGLIISLTAIGSIKKGESIRRSGAKVNELVCISGDVGGAYMGLKLLERESSVADSSAKEQLSKYPYLIERAIKPRLRSDIIKKLSESGLKPSSMIDISDGVASELLHICKKSNVGVQIYIDSLPIVESAFEAGDELGIDPIIAAMNAGEDYELLFTIPSDQLETVKTIDGINVVGYTTDASRGAKLITSQGAEIEIKAQGHKQTV